MNNNKEMPHLEINELSEKTMQSMRTRIIASIGLIALVVPAVFLGGWVFFVVIATVIAFGVYEMIRATKKKYPWWVWIFTYLVVFSYVYWFVIKANLLEFLLSIENHTSFQFSLEDYYSGIVVAPIGVAVAIGTYCLISILDKSFDFADVAYFVFFTLLLGVGFQSFFFLRYYPFYLFSHASPFKDMLWFEGKIGAELPSVWQFQYFWSVALIFEMLISATLSDIFAYFGGVFFGRHKMNPRISPNKTWEGFFFGIIGGVSCTFIFGVVMAACGFPVLPTLTLDKWYRILLLSVIGTLCGVLGDLSLSLIKRHYGIKDFGTLIPGHGGVMDRIDSNLFSAIGMTILLIFITNGWNFAL